MSYAACWLNFKELQDSKETHQISEKAQMKIEPSNNNHNAKKVWVKLETTPRSLPKSLSYFPTKTIQLIGVKSKYNVVKQVIHIYLH